MQAKSTLTMLLVGTLVSVSSLAGAADEQQNRQPAGNTPAVEKMEMNQGMRQGGMMGGGMSSGDMMARGMAGGGMMGMMKGCNQTTSNTMVPQLPPGNEKLQLQMQAEMMQKIGEILGKYADRIQDEKGAAH